MGADSWLEVLGQCGMTHLLRQVADKPSILRRKATSNPVKTIPVADKNELFLEGEKRSTFKANKSGEKWRDMKMLSWEERAAAKKTQKERKKSKRSFSQSSNIEISKMVSYVENISKHTQNAY